jgi:hypothetical protein
MYLDESTSQGKYKRYLLRDSYRENGHVRHRTIANLSSCSKEEIEAIRLALKHKENLTKLLAATKECFSEARSFGRRYLADIRHGSSIGDCRGVGK